MSGMQVRAPTFATCQFADMCRFASGPRVYYMVDESCDLQMLASFSFQFNEHSVRFGSKQPYCAWLSDQRSFSKDKVSA